MKKPARPPDLGVLWRETAPSGKLADVLSFAEGPLVGGKYLHWDNLRSYKPPQGLSHREWWLAIRQSRLMASNELPLRDQNGKPFRYMLPDPAPERLHQIDLRAGGIIQMPRQITNPETRDQYYVSSLIEEAITSSQLEGATTTREVAKEMLRSQRPARTRSERMIMNNYVTMRRIGDLKSEPLSQELVLELQRLVTHDALDDPSAAGRFRRPDERIAVVDPITGDVFHDPPPAEGIEQRVSEMCAFANGETPKGFLHPVVRSIALHFWLAYDHPFVDGNGRTARALFYWSMLRHGFWLFEFISISQIILAGPVQYGRAFLHTETDGNDLTYFILYHLDVVHRAIDHLHTYIARKSRDLQEVEQTLSGVETLNHRQRALISHALRHPHHRYTISAHRLSHGVVYQTARADLLDLQSRGLLQARKVSKEYQFTPVRDLAKRLAALA